MPHGNKVEENRILALRGFLETPLSLQQRANIVGALLKWPQRFDDGQSDENLL